jgi:undecaprenyl-diphosphatase
VRFIRGREDWVLVVLVLSSFALAFLFAKFGSQVHEGELKTIDVAVRDFVLQHRTPAGLAIFSALTLLGAKELLVPAGALIGWRLFRGTGWAWLVLLVFCALASAEFVALLKRTYQIGRPLGGIERSMGLSFPSGHSSGSAAVMIFLGYVAFRHGKPALIVVPIASLVVLLVGVSRLYLDMHWLTDVMGGWMIGAAFGAGSCALYELIQRHRRARSARQEASAAARASPG